MMPAQGCLKGERGWKEKRVESLKKAEEESGITTDRAELQIPLSKGEKAESSKVKVKSWKEEAGSWKKRGLRNFQLLKELEASG